jgi:hypothetical protein
MQAFHPDKKAQKFLYFIALTVRLWERISRSDLTGPMNRAKFAWIAVSEVSIRESRSFR